MTTSMTTMTHEINLTPGTRESAREPENALRSNRRGQNLSLADRARGGLNSAKQQRRDPGGRFAGAVKKASGSRSPSPSSTSPPPGHDTAAPGEAPEGRAFAPPPASSARRAAGESEAETVSSRR